MSRVKELENRWAADQLVTGVEFSQWLEVLKAGEWNIDRDYAHRLASITGLSLATSALGQLDDLRFGRQIAQMEIKPTPLFIIGHWRSGTTHLHDLLGRDPNHTFTDVYQVIFPTAFLSTRSVGTKLLANALPKKRSYDNMRMGWGEPAEDEIALLKLHGMSFYGALMFPDAAAKYEKYIDFIEATEAERTRWKMTFEWFLKKVMIASGGKRVIVKSCPHSARIRMILDLFPDAKFIHIHRHPYNVFASMMHMRGKVDWENFLQRPDEGFIQGRGEHTAAIGNRLFTRLIEDRAYIPPENLIEIGYDDFTDGKQLQYLEQIYAQFNLPDWERYRATLTPYLDSLKGYRTNKLNIDQELMDFVWDRWRIVFDTYGYKRELSK